MARVIDFVDGVTSETSPTIGNIVASGIVQYPDDAAYELNEDGAPAKGNFYYNTTRDVVRNYNGTIWHDQIDETTVQDVQNKTITASDIDADNNTVYNLEDENIKAGAGIDAEKIGSGNVDNSEYEQLDGVTSPIQDQLDDKIELSEKGAANGVVPLNGSTLIDSIYLPSYVDDVLEYANFAALPGTGESGKIYVTLDDDKTYRWTGSVYVEVGPSSQANNQNLIEGGNWDFVLGMTSDNVEFSQLLNDFSPSWTMDNNTTRVAYNFVPGSTFDASGITIDWNDVSPPTGEFVIELMPIIGGLPGEPDETNVLATTGTILASSIGVGPQTYYFLSPVTLTSGVQYAYSHRVTTIGAGGLEYHSNSSAPGSSYRYTTTDGGTIWSNSAGFTGTFEIISSSTSDSVLTNDADAYLQQEGFLKNRNTIQAQSINFPSGDDIAYVTVNKITDSLTNLTVNTAALSSFSPGEDDLIVARIIESGIEVGRKLYLEDGTSGLLKEGLLPASLLNLTDLVDVDITKGPGEDQKAVIYDHASGDFKLGSPVGTGGDGGINYVPNSDGEIDVSGYIPYKDTVSAVPVDGTGGSPVGIVASPVVSAPDVLRGSKSIGISKGTGNFQGEGIAIELDPISNSDTNSKLQVSFEYHTRLGTYTSGDIKCFIYDIDNATLLGNVVNDEGGDVLYSDNGKYSGEFYSTDSLNYRLIFHLPTTNTSDFYLVIDSVKVSPVLNNLFSNNSDWISYTPTLVNISGTPTGKWKRIGDSAYIRINVNVTSVSGAWTLSLPPGLVPDATKYPVGSANTFYDSAVALDVSTGATYLGVPFIQFGTVGCYGHGVARWTNTVPMTWASGDVLTVQLLMPVENWKSTNLVSNNELNVQTPFVTGQGNAATVLTANTTNIDFIETRDSSSSFNGTQFVAPKDGDYEVIGAIRTSAPFALAIYAHINGTQHRIAGFNGSSVASHPFAWKGYLLKGQTLSFRSDTSVTLSNVAALHWIEISSKPNYSNYGVINPNSNLIEASGPLAVYSGTVDQFADLTSILLTEGTWDIDAFIIYNSSGVTTTTNVVCGIFSTSGNSGGTFGTDYATQYKNPSSGANDTVNFFKKGINITVPTTYYLKSYATFSTTNLQRAYKISARRIK